MVAFVSSTVNMENQSDLGVNQSNVLYDEMTAVVLPSMLTGYSSNQTLVTLPDDECIHDFTDGATADVNDNVCKCFNFGYEIRYADHSIFNSLKEMYYAKLNLDMRPNKENMKRILCLDGGGVKGVVEAISLRYLQHAIQVHYSNGGPSKVTEELKKLITADADNGIHSPSGEHDSTESGPLPRLYQMFDIITGTSTGSIIACAVARLHWSPEQVIQKSKEIAQVVFPKPYRWNLFGRMKKNLVSFASCLTGSVHQYSPKPLEEYLRQEFGKSEWKQSGDEPVFGILATNKITSKVHVFNSDIYHRSKTVKIWQVVRASTAAPTYFKHYKIDDDIHIPTVQDERKPAKKRLTKYVDGGISANCPASYTMSMMHEEDDQIGCLVSVGCGDGVRESNIPFVRVLQMAMNNEENWSSFYDSHPRERKRLFRLTPNRRSGIGDYDLSDSSKVDEMERVYVGSLLEDGDEIIETIKKASSTLFAKSLRVLEMNMVYKEGKYLMNLVIKSKYHSKPYYYTGDALESKKLRFDQVVLGTVVDTKEATPVLIERDNLPALRLSAIYNNETNNVHIYYDNVEIAGSPVTIVRSFKYYEKEN